MKKIKLSKRHLRVIKEVNRIFGLWYKMSEHNRNILIAEAQVNGIVLVPSEGGIFLFWLARRIEDGSLYKFSKLIK